MKDRNSEALREDYSRSLFIFYHSLYFRLLESKQSFLISVQHIYSMSCMHTHNIMKLRTRCIFSPSQSILTREMCMASVQSHQIWQPRTMKSGL